MAQPKPLDPLSKKDCVIKVRGTAEVVQVRYKIGQNIHSRILSRLYKGGNLRMEIVSAQDEGRNASELTRRVLPGNELIGHQLRTLFFLSDFVAGRDRYFVEQVFFQGETRLGECVDDGEIEDGHICRNFVTFEALA